MTNSGRVLRIVGICTIVVIGFIHLRLAGGAFRNAPYEGALFVAAGMGGIFSALGISSRRGELGVVSVIAEVVFLTVFAMTRRPQPIAVS